MPDQRHRHRHLRDSQHMQQHQHKLLDQVQYNLLCLLQQRLPFGVGLGEVAGKVFRIGHLGSLTDVMTLSGIATAEMCMVDLGLDITFGSGVAAAQRYFSGNSAVSLKDAA